MKLGRTVTASHDVLCCRNWWNRRSTLDFTNWSRAPRIYSSECTTCPSLSITTIICASHYPI